jgi:hypothetical protein
MSGSAATFGVWSEWGGTPSWTVRRETPLESRAAPATATTGEPTPEELCEAHFLVLAEQRPARLVEWMQTVLASRPELLTFAAEAAGRIQHAPMAVRALLPLLGHPNAVVREGAVYGLAPHLLASLDARSGLRDLLANESSPGVREAIEEALGLLG